MTITYLVVSQALMHKWFNARIINFSQQLVAAASTTNLLNNTGPDTSSF